MKPLRAVIAVGLLLLLAAAALWTRQRSRYQEADDRLERRLERVRKEARELEIAAYEQQGAEAELKILRLKANLLEHFLPPALGLAEFRSGYEAECAKRKLTVVSWEAREDTSQPLHHGDITIRIKGDPARVAELRAGIANIARMTQWRDGPKQGDVQEVHLTVFALPPPPAESAPVRAPTACGTEDISGVWLPFYPALLKSTQEKIDQACARIASMSPAQQVAAERKALREHLFAVADAVEKLRSR